MSQNSRNEANTRTLDLGGTPEEVMRAVEALEGFAHSHGLPEKTIYSLMLALEECGSNIVNHALQCDPQQTFHVVLSYFSDALIIELRDHGPAFDPTAPAERPLQAHDDDVPGGWGIQLTRQTMDQIHYERRGDENILRLTKSLPPHGDRPSSSAKVQH